MILIINNFDMSFRCCFLHLQSGLSLVTWNMFLHSSGNEPKESVCKREKIFDCTTIWQTFSPPSCPIQTCHSDLYPSRSELSKEASDIRKPRPHVPGEYTATAQEQEAWEDTKKWPLCVQMEKKKTFWNWHDDWRIKYWVNSRWSAWSD